MPREGEGQGDKRHLEHDQPKASRQQEGREPPAALASRPLQMNGDAGEEHEGRGAEMRDPARGEQDGGGLRDVRRREPVGVDMEEVADVVEDHQDDHQAA